MNPKAIPLKRAAGIPPAAGFAAETAALQSNGQSVRRVIKIRIRLFPVLFEYRIHHQNPPADHHPFS
jgi:hypothetical protein